MDEAGDNLHALFWTSIGHIERVYLGGKYVDEVEMFEVTGIIGVTGNFCKAIV